LHLPDIQTPIQEIHPNTFELNTNLPPLPPSLSSPMYSTEDNPHEFCLQGGGVPINKPRKISKLHPKNREVVLTRVDHKHLAPKHEDQISTKGLYEEGYINDLP